MRTRTFRSLTYFGGGLGLITAIFAAAEFYDAQLAKACSFTNYWSCGKILSSNLTTTFGIQDWAWGVAGFVVILALAVLAERRPRDSRIPYLLLLITTAGVAISLYFLYVEVDLIGGLCPVCVVSYLLGGVAWVGAIGLAQRAYRRDHRTPDDASATA
ncbi:MAG: vitamin K epoxide reductase family protein [Thermoplasmata archaeon]